LTLISNHRTVLGAIIIPMKNNTLKNHPVLTKCDHHSDDAHDEWRVVDVDESECCCRENCWQCRLDSETVDKSD